MILDYLRKKRRIKTLADRARQYVDSNYMHGVPSVSIPKTEIPAFIWHEKKTVDLPVYENDGIKYSTPIVMDDAHITDTGKQDGKKDTGGLDKEGYEQAGITDDGHMGENEAPKDQPSSDRYNSSVITSAIREIQGTASALRAMKALDENTDASFVDRLLEYIDGRNMKDSDVYKKAQIDRRLFSKIASDRDYRPSKDTCISFCYALELSFSEANDLIKRAGYVLSHSSKRDIILEYFLKEGEYDIDDVNDVLHTLGQRTLGR